MKLIELEFIIDTLHYSTDLAVDILANQPVIYSYILTTIITTFLFN